MFIRTLGTQPYEVVWNQMKTFSCKRLPDTIDELWLLEHHAVYTQGQAGKTEHILNPRHIPIVKTDRGGQVTFHGPGQLIAYTLIDIARRETGIRTFVCQLEQVITHSLEHFGIVAQTRCGAPGVYVNEKKIASIGLRVKNGRTYHGIALNVAMDMTPFAGINPCGYTELQMTQMQDYIPDITVKQVSNQFTKDFLTSFGC